MGRRSDPLQNVRREEAPGTAEEEEPSVDPAALKEQLRARLGLPPGDPYSDPGPSAALVDPPPAADPPPADAPPATADTPTVLSILRQGKPKPPTAAAPAKTPPAGSAGLAPFQDLPTPAPPMEPARAEEMVWSVAEGAGHSKLSSRMARPWIRFEPMGGRIRVEATLLCHGANGTSATDHVTARGREAGPHALAEAVHAKLGELEAVRHWQSLNAELLEIRHEALEFAAEVRELEAQRERVLLSRTGRRAPQLHEIDGRLDEARQQHAIRESMASILERELPPARQAAVKCFSTCGVCGILLPPV
jgi:hypothetical protein